MDNAELKHSPGWWGTWAVALRLYSVPASLAPVAFGTVLAYWQTGQFGFVPFLAVLAVVVSFHLAANLFNDVGDFASGVDSPDQAVTGSGAVVRGWVSPGKALRVGAAAVAVGFAAGTILVWQLGWPAVVLGLVGAAAAVLYTLSPWALKYHGLGDATVFLFFGSLPSLGAWMAQTGKFSWLPVIWSMPLGLLVTGILHLNNWRDRETDRAANITTVATVLSDLASRAYFGVLVFGGFLFVALALGATRMLGVEPVMPWTFILVVLALPMAVQLYRTAHRYAGRGDTEGMGYLVQKTAQLSGFFGFLTVAALVIDAFLQ